MRTRLLISVAVIGLGGSLAVAQPSPDRGAYASWAPSLASPAPVAQQGSPQDEAEPFQLWGRVDYLLWWLKPVCLKPPTLTLGSPADPSPGAIGQAHTIEVLGEHKFEFGGNSGIRPTVGVWLMDDQLLGIEAEGFVLMRAAAGESFRSAANGSPASYIPFQAPTNEQTALPFTVPGVIAGSSLAVGHTHLWGLESNLVSAFSTRQGDWLLGAALLAGFRYLDLRDQVTITNTLNLVADPSAVAFGQDSFTTRNQFYGGQLGLRLGAAWGSWSIDLQTKMALGETHQVSQVAGSPLMGGTLISPVLLPGPFLALPSNIGRSWADRITLVPEAGSRIHLQLTDYLLFSVGYSVLYWNKVLCPGDQMDSHVNVTQLPFHGPVVGAAVPAPMFVHTDAFAQGLNIGMEVRY